MNIITNLLALLILVAGLFANEQHLTNIGSFALSGALTNWLAVHMLFEKVPLLYGSGIIPNRFEEFKLAIKHLIMEQFFTEENIGNFFKASTELTINKIDIDPILQAVDYDKLFNGLVDAVMNSSMGAMVSMVGGPQVFESVRPQFEAKLKETLADMGSNPDIAKIFAEQTSLLHPEIIREKVTEIIDGRLDELTPNMVKVIVQEMIKEHLGWLVVWGGIFGGLIGLGMSLRPI